MTFHGLKWPWGHEEGSLVAIFRFRMSIIPETRRLRMFRMAFIQNKRFSISSHWLIMKRSQNWPDLTSPISKFGDIHFIDTITSINRWKYQGNRLVGVALTSIQTFYEVRSLDVACWHNLAWPGSETFTTYVEKMHDKVCQKRRHCATQFFGNLEKRRGLSAAPPQRAKDKLSKHWHEPCIIVFENKNVFKHYYI